MKYLYHQENDPADEYDPDVQRRLRLRAREAKANAVVNAFWALAFALGMLALCLLTKN